MGAQEKNEKRPQLSVQVAEQDWPLQGCLQWWPARGQHRNRPFSSDHFFRLRNNYVEYDGKNGPKTSPECDGDVPCPLRNPDSLASLDHRGVGEGDICRHEARDYHHHYHSHHDHNQRVFRSRLWSGARIYGGYHVRFRLGVFTKHAVLIIFLLMINSFTMKGLSIVLIICVNISVNIRYVFHDHTLRNWPDMRQANFCGVFASPGTLASIPDWAAPTMIHCFFIPFF